MLVKSYNTIRHLWRNTYIWMQEGSFEDEEIRTNEKLVEKQVDLPVDV